MKIIYGIRGILPPIIQNTIKYIYTRGNLDRSICKIVTLSGLLQKKIIIGKHTKSDKQENLLPIGVEIGDYTSLKSNLTFYSTHKFKIRIGNFCTIASGARFIAASSHNYNCLTTYSRLVKPDDFEDIGKTITLENDVRIGTNATILEGVTIGTGAVIGASSVVTKDIPPYGIAVGNPAKVIKYRFDDNTIKKLLESKWWDRDVEKIKKNYYLEFIKSK